MTFYSPDDGTDPRGIVGKVTPASSPEGRCLRVRVRKRVGASGSLQAAGDVAWSVELPHGVDAVWSCEGHADELPWARRVRGS